MTNGTAGSERPEGARSGVEPEQEGLPSTVHLYGRLPLTDVDRWWVELADRSPDGRVLYVGCGTGRLALPIARAATELVGVDVDGEMLAAFQARLDADEELGAKVRLVHAAAQEVDLGEQFGLVVLPSNLLNGIVDPSARVAAVRAAAAHCHPDGLVVLQVLNPYWMAQRFDHAEGELRGDEPADRVEVTIEGASFDVWEQRQHARLRYRFPDGEELVDVIDAVALYPRELRALAYQAGLELVERYGPDPRTGRELDLVGGTWHLVCRPLTDPASGRPGTPPA